jgi:hypothetical protein
MPTEVSFSTLLPPLVGSFIAAGRAYLTTVESLESAERIQGRLAAAVDSSLASQLFDSHLLPRVEAFIDARRDLEKIGNALLLALQMLGHSESQGAADVTRVLYRLCREESAKVREGWEDVEVSLRAIPLNVGPDSADGAARFEFGDSNLRDLGVLLQKNSLKPKREQLSAIKIARDFYKSYGTEAVKKAATALRNLRKPKYKHLKTPPRG